MCLKSKCKSQIYVKDLRTPVLFHNKRLKYPKNYDKIVKDGKIIQGVSSEGPVLKLLYGKKDKNGMQPCFTLTSVTEDVCHSKTYYTIYSLLTDIKTLGKGFYEPFGFTRITLEKYLPVFDIKTTDDPNNPYQIANTLYIAGKGHAVSEETGEVDDISRKEKGLNGKQLYYSFYGKRDPSFWVVKDEYDKTELDKSILCFLVSLFVYTFIFLRILITFLPMKLGECLLCLKNPIAKVLGNIFFTPFVPLKFVVDLSAIFLKSPILLFVGNEKKYGNKYCVLWKYEFIGCFYELTSDCSIIKNGSRPIITDFDEYNLIGTWNELNVRSNYIDKTCDLP